MVCAEDQCNKVTISMLPVNTLLHWQKCIDGFACRLVCKYCWVSPFFKHYFQLIAREAKACQTKQRNIFYLLFISRISVFQASQALFCGYMWLKWNFLFQGPNYCTAISLWVGLGAQLHIKPKASHSQQTTALKDHHSSQGTGQVASVRPSH